MGIKTRMIEMDEMSRLKKQIRDLMNFIEKYIYPDDQLEKAKQLGCFKDEY